MHKVLVASCCSWRTRWRSTTTWWTCQAMVRVWWPCCRRKWTSRREAMCRRSSKFSRLDYPARASRAPRSNSRSSWTSPRRPPLSTRIYLWFSRGTRSAWRVSIFANYFFDCFSFWRSSIIREYCFSTLTRKKINKVLFKYSYANKDIIFKFFNHKTKLC